MKILIEKILNEENILIIVPGTLDELELIRQRFNKDYPYSNSWSRTIIDGYKDAINLCFEKNKEGKISMLYSSIDGGAEEYARNMDLNIMHLTCSQLLCTEKYKKKKLEL